MITTGEVLQKIRPNSSWRLIEDDLSTITWIRDDENDKGVPSEKEIEDTRKIMQAEYDALEYSRNRAGAYDSVGNQLDQLMKDMRDGTKTHQESCEAVKARFPKPE